MVSYHVDLSGAFWELRGVLEDSVVMAGALIRDLPVKLSGIWHERLQ